MNIHMTGEQKQRILVVDDSEDMRDLLQRLLERAGYRVVLAADGQAFPDPGQTAPPRSRPDGPVVTGHGWMGSRETLAQDA